MTTHETPRAGRGYIGLAEASRAGVPADRLLETAVCDLSEDLSPQEFVGGTLDAFVTKARAVAVAPLTPASPIAPYLALVSQPTPPSRLTISAGPHELELSDDPNELAELVEVTYALEGWEGLRRIHVGIERRKAELRAELEAAQKAMQETKSWTSSDVSGGTPERMLEARAALPTLVRQAEEASRSVPEQLALLGAITTTLQAQKDVLVVRFETLLEQFEAEARADLRRVLAQSEATALQELKRYGVRKLGDPLGTVTLEDNDDSKGLREGLKKLAEYRKLTIRTLQKEVLASSAARVLVDFAAVLKLWSEIMSGLDILSELTPSGAHTMRNPLYTAAHAQENDVRRQLLAAQHDYAKMRAALADKYPIVNRIAEVIDESSDAEDVAKAIYWHTDLVRNNIKQIRDEAATDRPAATREQVMFSRDIDPLDRVVRRVASPSIDIWHIPRIIIFTQQRMGFEPGGLGYSMVERVLARVPAARREREELWDVVSLALGFLAAPTGGVSLLVLGVISSSRAISEIAEHKEQLMLLNSALEPVRILIDEEPSALQLLGDLVSYGLDIFEAGAALRKLAGPASRTARLEALKSLVGKRGSAEKLLNAEERLVKKELAEAIAVAEKTVKKESAPAIKDALTESEKRASRKRGAASAKGKAPDGGAKKGAAKEATKPKTPKSAAASVKVAANDIVSTRRLAETAIAAVKRQFPELASRLDPLLHSEDWEKIMTRISGFVQAPSPASYERLLDVVQGNLLELMVPHFPEFKEALESAVGRAAKAPGVWSEVRVARVVNAAGSPRDIKDPRAYTRTLFSDFVFWAEGAGADNKGYVLLLTFIEAKSGDPTSLFRKEIITATGARIKTGVGQLGRIEERLRSAIWLDGRPVSFENMVYMLPSADLDPTQRLTKYVAVMQRTPTWEDVGDLVAAQRLNADVWISPIKRDELRAVSNVLLSMAGKAPELKAPLGALVSPVVRQAGRSESEE